MNATYAAPNPKYGIDEVTDRLYRGLCSNTPQLAKTLQQFRNVEPEIRQLIDEQVGLMEAEKVRMQRYVDKYYADVGTQEAIRNNLVRSCN